jgi:hypothetical protein
MLGAGLKAAGGLVALGAAGYAGYRWPHPTPTQSSTSQPTAGVQSFISRPDLKPASVTVYASPGLRTSRTPRQIALAPRDYALGAPGQAGIMILGVDGHLQWFQPTAGTPMNVEVQTYQGRPVLTWWEGEIVNGYGKGTCPIVDQSYRQVATVRAGNGLEADLHEFQLTPQGTALITAYNTIKTNLSAVNGPPSGSLLEGVVQEIDVATGSVLFEWHSIDHVGIAETYAAPPGPSPTAPFDYFHINSIGVAPDGDLLVSARNTWTVYKIARGSGAVVWRLHGKRSDFAVAPQARFYWQHDARALGPGTISLFDDGSSPPQETQSRGIVLGIDTATMKATLQRQYTHPAELLAPNQGSMQSLADGGAFVGWGAEPYFSQFGSDGRMLLDGRMPNNVQSYRSYLVSWAGQPTDAPTLAVRSSALGGSTVYASWNGATAVTTWHVLAGASAASLKQVASEHRTGFETAIAVASPGPYFAVAALDRTGRELGRSQPVKA